MLTTLALSCNYCDMNRKIYTHLLSSSVQLQFYCYVKERVLLHTPVSGNPGSVFLFTSFPVCALLNNVSHLFPDRLSQLTSLLQLSGSFCLLCQDDYESICMIDGRFDINRSYMYLRILKTLELVLTSQPPKCFIFSSISIRKSFLLWPTPRHSSKYFLVFVLFLVLEISNTFFAIFPPSFFVWKNYTSTVSIIAGHTHFCSNHFLIQVQISFIQSHSSICSLRSFLNITLLYQLFFDLYSFYRPDLYWNMPFPKASLKNYAVHTPDGHSCVIK